MTCVADPYRALCRIRTDQGGGRFTGVSDCRLSAITSPGPTVTSPRSVNIGLCSL